MHRFITFTIISLLLSCDPGANTNSTSASEETNHSSEAREVGIGENNDESEVAGPNEGADCRTAAQLCEDGFTCQADVDGEHQCVRDSLDDEQVEASSGGLDAEGMTSIPDESVASDGGSSAGSGENRIDEEEPLIARAGENEIDNSAGQISASEGHSTGGGVQTDAPESDGVRGQIDEPETDTQPAGIGGTDSTTGDNDTDVDNVHGGESLILWAHTFNGELGPGTGAQPGNMESAGSQGFTDGGSWVSTGGWLIKTISTLGFTDIEVSFLLTKDASSTCNLDLSADEGRTWTTVLSDVGDGGYRIRTNLPNSAHGQPRVQLRWTALNAWCWMNNILITGLPTVSDAGSDGESNTDETHDEPSAEGNSLHIFLLMGQSNMVGCDSIGEADRLTDERIRVLGYETCPDTGRLVNEWTIASPPLHTCSTGIGPGDYFARTLAEGLPQGDRIGLVPTAVSGQWIETFMLGGVHHQNILSKIRVAAAAENARFSGIIFHQGESNAGDPTWPAKVQQLYDQLKTAMEIDRDIPFIAGEMLYGGSSEGHNAFIRQLPSLGNHFDYVSAEGLVMAPNDEWNVHFSCDSQVILGGRYGRKMREALGW